MMLRTVYGLALLMLFGAFVHGDDPIKSKDEKPKEADKKPVEPLPLDKLIAQHKELVPTLIDGLRDPDAQVRQMAAFTLGQLGKDAVPALSDALASKDRDLRANAAYALGQFGRLAQDAVPALIKAMRDPDGDVRQRAFYSLQRILADSAVAPPTLPMPAPKDEKPAPKEEKQGASLIPTIVPVSYRAPAVRPSFDPGLVLPSLHPTPPRFPE